MSLNATTSNGNGAAHYGLYAPNSPATTPVRGADLKGLRASGLTDETIADNGLYEVCDPALMAELLNRIPQRLWQEIKEFCQYGGLVFPYFNLFGQPMDGYVRIRPHCPRIVKGKPAKYEAPAGSSSRAYFPAGCRGLLKSLRYSNVLITEGEKKALSLAQHGYAVIGLGGVWNGVEKDAAGNYSLINDLAKVPWQGRIVYIVFDYDPKPTTRRHVRKAARRLEAALLAAGVKEVKWVALSPGPEGDKQGVDDYLMAEGKEAFAALLKRAGPVPADGLSNYSMKEVDEEEVAVGRTVRQIHTSLQELTGGWPKRCGRLLFVPCGPAEDAAQWLETPNQTFAWIGAQLEEPIQWIEQGRDKVSRSVFDAHLRMAAADYAAVEAYPHSPPLTGHYYLHPPVAGGNGERFQQLLDAFAPATAADRSLIQAAFMTPLWGGAPGSRPAFLIERGKADEDGEEVEAGDDDGTGLGVGKSKLAQFIALLVGSYMEVEKGLDIGKVKTRMLSPAALTRRVALLDNVKTLKFSWAELEGLITCDTISGHQMYVGEGRRPNTFTWLITLNNASLSRDLAQRCVIVRLRRPTYDPAWEDGVRRLIQEYRWEIIGDILALLGGPKEPLDAYTRWAAWEQEVMAACPDPAGALAAISARQAAIDGDQEEADLLQRAFARELKQWGHDPATCRVFLPSKVAADIYNEATGEKLPAQTIGRRLMTYAIRELRKVKRSDLGGRVWVWTGAGADPRTTPVPIHPYTDETLPAL
jgi:hypothetical protein